MNTITSHRDLNSHKRVVSKIYAPSKLEIEREKKMANEPASDYQKEILTDLNITFNPSISMLQADELIAEAKNQEPATDKQINLLIDLKVDIKEIPNITKEDASKLIDLILK